VASYLLKLTGIVARLLPPPYNFSGGCLNLTPWSLSRAYRPYDPDITRLLVKVNFIFWEHQTPLVESDGTITHGNFDMNDPVQRQFINNFIAEMNSRVGDLNLPTNTTCFNASDLDLGQYIQFSKIQFDVQTYNIRDSYLWNIQNATDND